MRIDSNFNSIMFNENLKKDNKELETFELRFKELAEKKDIAAIKEVAADFEELFVNLLMKNMRRTVRSTGFSEESSYQREMFEGMLDEAYAKEIAKTGSLGIADMIVESFTRYMDTDKDKKELKKIDMYG